MKTVITLLILSGLALAVPAHADRTLKAKGFVTFKEGTMEGEGRVTLRERSDGTWFLDLGSLIIEAGRDVSKDPNLIVLKNYRFWRRYGVRATYNKTERTLVFRYKYDSGWLGGGVQQTGSTFSDVEEVIEDNSSFPGCTRALFQRERFVLPDGVVTPDGVWKS
ncbi:hypothetical protein K2X33_07485 [bacterium]|nr:hypothetical protein [bacterium]